MGIFTGCEWGSILYRITTSSSYHELGPMSSTQNIDGDLMQASDGNLWGDFFQPLGIVFSSTLSGSVLENITLNANVNGEQPFGILQAADGKLYGMSFGNRAPTNGQPSNGAFWVIDAGLAPPEARSSIFGRRAVRLALRSWCKHRILSARRRSRSTG